MCGSWQYWLIQVGGEDFISFYLIFLPMVGNQPQAPWLLHCTASNEPHYAFRFKNMSMKNMESNVCSSDDDGLRVRLTAFPLFQ